MPYVLFDRPAVLFSTDGTRFIFDRGRDLWLADLTTGEERNLTGTPDRFESWPVWWPARPDTVVFGSVTEEDCCWAPGFLTTVRLDGSGHEILDEEESSYSPFAPSPDGQTIAYDRAGTPWLYHWDTGPAPLRPEEFGLSDLIDPSFVSPAWSPDGKQLAWVVFNSPVGKLSIGVFDLVLRTARLLHPYEPAGFDGIVPGPVWSPDGRWLSFFAPAKKDDERGMWVVESNGLEGRNVCTGCYSWNSGVWSPDSRSLAYIGSSGQIWVIEVRTWAASPVKLAAGVELVSWVEVK